MFGCLFCCFSEHYWFVFSWMNLNFEEFIFANSLSGFSDDGDGGYDDDLDKLMDNSVSKK